MYTTSGGEITRNESGGKSDNLLAYIDEPRSGRRFKRTGFGPSRFLALIGWNFRPQKCPLLVSSYGGVPP
jgi:hypothetical protein